MDIEIKTWLYDILNAINEIESFLADSPKDFIAYQNDLRTKRAVERNIEIIGEAMNRILNKNHAIQFSNSRKIVDTRNRIIHGYDSVSDDIIWSIVIKHLPQLKSEIVALIGD
jgi:uncharacterized protein with HEPN domain